MTESGILQIVVYLCILFILVKPFGTYIAQVYQDQPTILDVVVKPIARFIYRICGIDPHLEMNWINYLFSMLVFNFAGLLLVYAIQRFQYLLPLNPQSFPAVAPDLAFNTAASFVTNTNWQAYSGETTMSYFTQMLAFTVQNFLSAATGMSLLVAVIRGFVRAETTDLGNFWVDTVRGTLYIFLPLAFILSIALVSQGVIQNIKPYQTTTTYQTETATPQLLPMGPVASQVAIKQLGTNGGGFFNTNSAYPFENPTPLSNFLEMLAILLIPTALCYTYGVMVKDRRQGWALLIAMTILLVPLIFAVTFKEQQGNPLFNTYHIDQAAHHGYSAGGNMEGKEVRFGIVASSLWSTVTTATSNGSVNSMLDSYTPIGGLIPLWLMHLGEVVFGGVGSGLYGMLMVVIITVFVAGLMVGRTPEYLGKKIEPFEMKMASVAVLLMPLTVLLMTAIAVVSKAGVTSLGNTGPHGFTEILYTFTSMINNNGSSFAGLNANTLFYNLLGGVGILIGRYWIAIPTLALAGSLARKKTIRTSVGTLPTHTPLFIFLLIAVVIVLGALTFFPALSLGPIVENLMLN